MSPPGDDPLDQQARNEHGAEERSDDTDDKGRGEALYGAVTEDEEHDTGDDGRQVTVDDGRVGFRETVFDGQREPLAAAQLLLDTFVDDDVGIDGHTHRQDDTRDTRQRQHGAERHQDAHQQEDVGQQGDVGHPACGLVEQAHVEQHEDEGDHERKHTRVDRLLTQRGAHDGILDDLGRSGNLTRVEYVGKVFRLLNREVARDLRGTLVDLGVHAGCGIYVPVEDDGDAFADVLARQTRPLLRTLAVHGHRHLGRSAALGVLLRGARHDRPVQRSLAVGRGNLDGIKVVAAVDLIVALDTPLEVDVGREELAHRRVRQVFVDGSHVGLIGGTDGGPTRITRVEHGQQRVLRTVVAACVHLPGSGNGIGADLGDQACGVAGSGLLTDGLGFGRSGLGLRGGGELGQLGLDELIGGCQCGKHLAGIVGQPEFERRGTLQQVAHTLRLLHARQLDQDAVRVGQTHDVGLRNAEMVDTAAQDVERSGDGGIGFLLEDFLDVGIGAFERDVLAVGADEDRSQRTAVRKALVGLHEVGNIVFRGAVLQGRVGLGDGADEGGIVLAVAGERLDDILDLHLQHDVHTALEVETQVQFLLLALLVGELLEPEVINTQILNRIEVMLFGLALLVEGELRGVLRRLLLYAPRLEREGELVNTRKRQKDCE